MRVIAQDFPWDDINTFLAILGGALLLGLAGGVYAILKAKRKTSPRRVDKDWGSSLCETCGSKQDYEATHTGEKIIDCPGCNGTGKYTIQPDHKFVEFGWVKAGAIITCPYCGGSGKLAEEIP